MKKKKSTFLKTSQLLLNNSEFKKYLFIVIWSLLLIFIILTQSKTTGFSNGHHGWVTSHNLSIIKRAAISNYFVGYSGDIIEDNNKINHFYFNRAPFIFLAICHILLKPFDNNDHLYIYFAHQIMNIIFFLTILFTFKIVNFLLKDNIKSFIAVFFIFSGYYFIYYKDLVEQNRPGVLAIILGTYGILKYWRQNNIKFLFFYITIACFMGEGTPILFVLIIWNIIEFIDFVIIHKEHFILKLLFFFKKMSVITMLFAVVLTCLIIGYNIIIESKINKIPIKETSIVNSAIKRLGGDEQFQKDYSEKLIFPNYEIRQFKRIIKGILPYFLTRKSGLNVLQYLVLFIMTAFFLFYKFFKEINWHNLKIGILILFPCLIYMIIMKNLAAFHDFTATYYIGISIFIAICLVKYLPKQSLAPILIGLIIIFSINIILVNNDLTKMRKPYNIFNQEFRSIKEIVTENNKTFFFENKFEQVINGVPFAPFFYLYNHNISENIDYADYVISKEKRQSALTPQNKILFLYKK